MAKAYGQPESLICGTGRGSGLPLLGFCTECNLRNFYNRGMKLDLKLFAALLAGLVVLGAGYYFLILIPQQEKARFELQRQQIEREEEAKTKRAAFLTECRAEAQKGYESAIRLNGTEVPGRPGVYKAPQATWDKAAEDRKAYIDECLRLAEAGIYQLPSLGADQTPVVEATPNPDPTLAVLDDAEVAQFADAYLKAGEQDQLPSALNLYADMVDYYDQGLVSKEVLYQDKQDYMSRWPQRRYQRVSGIATLASTSSTRTIRFDYIYRVARPGKQLSGKAYVVLGLEKFGDQIRITQEKGKIY